MSGEVILEHPGRDDAGIRVCRRLSCLLIHSEAVRKPLRTVAARSSSILAVMKRRATAGRESVQHTMSMTDLDHSRPGFSPALIVLAVPAIPARPGVRPLHHPAFLQRRAAFCARRTRLHCKTPARPMRGSPGVEGVVVSLLIRNDRAETRQVVGCDMAEPLQG